LRWTRKNNDRRRGENRSPVDKGGSPGREAGVTTWLDGDRAVRVPVLLEEMKGPKKKKGRKVNVKKQRHRTIGPPFG